MSLVEWEQLQTELPRRSEVKGKVVSVQRFGVFVDIGLDPCIPMLLEIIHFKIREQEPEHRINFPDDYPASHNSATWSGFTADGCPSSREKVTPIRLIHEDHQE
jgi:hypothetical protein